MRRIVGNVGAFLSFPNGEYGFEEFSNMLMLHL